MCGIFLIKSKKNPNIYLSQFKKSLNELKTRGPDEITFFKKKNFLIGFTRLSINNLESQNQPYQSENKRYTLLFNGEILNYKFLIVHLVEKKIKLKEYTEAEVIFYLYILYNKKFLNYIKGFFSIVIIDHFKDEIFACVDQFSIKPLYYYKSDELTIFTSNLSPLINNKLVNKDIDHNEIINFVSLGREINNKTIFKNIFRLTASTYLTLDQQQIKIIKYWSPFNKNENKFSFVKNSKLYLSNNLDLIANLWKTSDVELSNTISSGVDSNLLNFFFKKNNILTTNFSVKERSNQIIGKNDFQVNIQDFDVEKILNKFIKTNLDPIPLVNSSSLTLLYLYKEISKRKFKVCFSGEGADEIFGGYSRYLKHITLIKKRNGNLYKSFLDLYQQEVELSNYAIKRKNFNVHNHLLDQIKKIKLNSKSNINKILEFDQITWVPSVIKRHDFIGMFYSLEVRPPFLDRDFVQNLNRVPEKFKIYKNKQKIVAYNLLKKEYNFNVDKKKISTPSYFKKMMTKNINQKNLKENIFYGKLSKVYNPKKTWEICSNQFYQDNNLFLWRIFVLNKILN